MRKFNSAAWKRLGRVVRQERSVLQMRQRDLADAMGMSVEIVYAIEVAKRPVTAETLWRLEDAMGWEPNSSLAVLEGAGAPQKRVSQEPPDLNDPQTGVTQVEDVSMELDTMLMSIFDTWGAPAVMRSIARVLAARRDAEPNDGPNA